MLNVMVNYGPVAYAAGACMVAVGLVVLVGRPLAAVVRAVWRGVAVLRHRSRRTRMVGAHREVRPHRSVRVLRPVVVPPAPRPRYPQWNAPTTRWPSLADRTELIPAQRGDR